MPRSWIEKSRDKKFRLSIQYKIEVNNFIEYAFSNASQGDRILCPCIKCVNQIWRTKEEVLEHLICDGFLWNYTKWSFHGEGSSSNVVHHESKVVHGEDQTIDITHNMLNELRGRNMNEEVGDGVTGEHVDRSSVDTDKFDRLMEDAKEELYPGCVRFTRLSFILRLYHIKCLCKITDKGFSMLLDLLREALPESNTLPKNMYETKKIIKDLGLNYNKIDACPNDCMLYWKEAEKATSCSKCGTSRYEPGDKNIPIKKVPAKTLWYFPLIPRLQRLYMSSKTSLHMRWHHESRKNDQRLRHPADGQAWKEFDRLHPSFSEEPRNIRLGLACDGFNPYNGMSIPDFLASCFKNKEHSSHYWKMDSIDEIYRNRVAALIRALYAIRCVKEDNVPCKIEEGLFLGSVGAASNKNETKNLNITHILTIANLSALDWSIYPNDSGVLVHYFVGRSRSVTVVVAYLMKKYHMSLSQAM